MGKNKKKKKKYSSVKAIAAIRRKAEIEEHGKVLSFRPGSSFKSKKEYKRQNKVVDYEEEVE